VLNSVLRPQGLASITPQLSSLILIFSENLYIRWASSSHVAGANFGRELGKAEIAAALEVEGSGRVSDMLMPTREMISTLKSGVILRRGHVSDIWGYGSPSITHAVDQW